MKESFFAAVYDPFLWMGEQRGMRARRAALLSEARGRVLEIGAGTGLNLRHYPSDVSELILTEPVEPMYKRLRKRAAGRPEVVVRQTSGDRLPAAEDSVDTVVSTLVLCTVPEVEPVLDEIARVLRPGGLFLFCEHVLSHNEKHARTQRRVASAWVKFAGGCRTDRDTASAVAERFEIKRMEDERWHGMPSWVRPLITGSASVWHTHGTPVSRL